jgi:hypothetical protein
MLLSSVVLKSRLGAIQGRLASPVLHRTPPNPAAQPDGEAAG